MSNDISPTTDEVYFILRHSDGTVFTGSTPVGCVTSFDEHLYSVIHQGTDRNEWAKQCKIATDSASAVAVPAPNPAHRFVTPR